MALITLNVKDNVNQSFNTLLEDTLYDITLSWNARDEAWYISLAESGMQPLFKTKVTNGIDLLKKYRAYDSCPKGGLFVLDRNKKYGRVTRDAFSSGRFSLVYLTEDSREALEL